MRIIPCVQGGDEWHQHRAKNYRTAGRAPALMGASPYQTRSQLLAEIATGMTREHDAATLARFARGHEVEPALREYAERVAGTEFFPIVALSDDEYLSASFDGVSMDEAVICECKQWNTAKVEAICEGRVPDEDYWQIVAQFAVCDTAQTCIYAVGDGTPERTYHLEIKRETIWEDIGELRSAWKQFDADLAAYQHRPAAAAVVATPVEGFGALSLRVEGRVLASNLDAFRAGAEAFIARLPKPAELKTDQDFADADAAVKACSEAESRIKAAKDAALAQMADVDAVLRAADSIAETIRAARLALDKAVKTEKENRRAELIRSAADAVRAHYTSVNATLPGHELGVPASLTADLGASIKGLKSLSSIQDKLDGAVAQAKIAANMEADRRRLCIAVIEEFAEHRALIPDAAALVASKAPDDIRNLIRSRIAEHEAKVRKQAEEAAERERERIRREEEDRAKRLAEQERQRVLADENAQRTQAMKLAALEAEEARLAAAANLSTTPADDPVAQRPATIKLGEINSAIAPLRIDAAGLAELGVHPVGKDKAAILYAESDLPAIFGRMAQRIVDAAKQHALRRAA